MWFTTYTGSNWRPSHGYNEYFKKDVVKVFVDWFSLIKKSPGRYGAKTPNLWVNYGNMRGHNVFVRVDDLNLTGYVNRENYDSPTFTFTLTIARAVTPEEKTKGLKDLIAAIFRPDESAEDQGVDLEVIFQQRMYMEFPDDPRLALPMFKIQSFKYHFGHFTGSHNYHQLPGNWLCLLPDRYNSTKQPSVISSLNIAIDWVMWYETTHGKLS